MYLWAEILFKFQWQIEKLCLELDLGPGFSSTPPLSFKTILKNQKWLTYKNITLICKIICKYPQIVRDLTFTMYESEDSKYTIEVNK